MKCCPRCFDDPYLSSSEFPQSPSSGRCDFCGEADQLLLEPSQLRDLFEPLVAIYEPVADGQPLAELLKSDWALFPRLDSANASRLLAEILDDGEIVRLRFKPSAACHPANAVVWEKFRAELLHKNRFFLSTKLDESRLRALLGYLVAKEESIPRSLFRARLLLGESPFPASEMGAPPAEQAGHGRANPPGIPYLYLASTPETAIAEVRPHTGELVCVADFQINERMSLADLRTPRATVSPFVAAGDSEQIALLHGDLHFLSAWSDELTRPIVPWAAHIGYLPSQYLCEFVKSCGFSGVIYRSAMEEGLNLALFDPNLATVGAVAVYRIDAVKVRSSRLN